MFEQIVPYLMTTTGQTSYGAGQQFVSSFNDLPSDLDGMIPHLAGILFDIEYTPVFTTAPTIYGVNNLVSSLQIQDGINPRLDVLGFNGLRSHEIFETGDVTVPDPDTNSGTGNRFRVTRLWTPGPQGMRQNDFMLPVPCVKNGEVRATWGALTAHSADTTAITINRLTMVALLSLRPNEFRIPVFFERRSANLSASNQPIQGNGLYTHLGFTRANYAAFAAGDIGNLSIDTGRGVKGSVSVPAAAYDAVNQALLRVSQFTKIRGEFSTATVDNEKTVNLGTPTALAAADATHQSFYVTPRGGMLTKVPLRGNNIRPQWTGTATNLTAHYGRVIPQPAQAIANYIQRGTTELDKPYIAGNTKVATESKVLWKGGDAMLMPFKYKLS